MENFDLPPGGAPQDARATQQFWPLQDAVMGQEYPGAPGAPGSPRPRPRHRARRWAAGISAAVLLAAGGTAAGLALAGPAASQPTGQAAALNAVLSSANSATGLSSSSTGAAPRACAAARAARAARRSGQAGTGQAGTGPTHPRLARLRALACRHPLFVRALLRGLHGMFTFNGRSGVRTLAFERGTVTSVAAGSDIVVRAADGTTWTWDLVSTTVVREHGTKPGTGALTRGETVWVGGPVVAGAKDARLVLIRPATGSAASSAAPAG